MAKNDYEEEVFEVDDVETTHPINSEPDKPATPDPKPVQKEKRPNVFVRGFRKIGHGITTAGRFLWNHKWDIAEVGCGIAIGVTGKILYDKYGEVKDDGAPIMIETEFAETDDNKTEDPVEARANLEN